MLACRIGQSMLLFEFVLLESILERNEAIMSEAALDRLS